MFHVNCSSPPHVQQQYKSYKWCVASANGAVFMSVFESLSAGGHWSTSLYHSVNKNAAIHIHLANLTRFDPNPTVVFNHIRNCTVRIMLSQQLVLLYNFHAFNKRMHWRRHRLWHPGSLKTTRPSVIVSYIVTVCYLHLYIMIWFRPF